VKARLGDRPTLREAVDEWLYRTPIEGSTPDRPGDPERVRGFIERYCEAHRREVESQKQISHHEGQRPEDAARIDARYAQEVESARRFLLAEDVPAEERDRRSRIRVAVLFIESYRELPLLAWPREAIDGIVTLEQAFVIFRQRHARMVERMIGRRTGTGGSAGVEYIDRTALAYRVFRDVWAVRTVLLRQEALPPLAHPDAYALPVGS
jgi:tryptophan 2,3-dioxygenase